MSDKTNLIRACKKELDRLKKEEAFIRELLRDVQKQLGKYKVEALHMSHVSLTDVSRGEKLDHDELTTDNEINAELPEVAEVINKTKLNLELTNEWAGEEFEESDESELSD